MRIFLLSVCLVIVITGLNLAIEPEDVVSGHVWLFDGGGVTDSTARSLTGTITGAPEVVPGIDGDALSFDGSSDFITIPDSNMINISSGPWPNRTVMAVFNCVDVSLTTKQTIYEEGGRTRGIVLYVHDGLAYVGGWNRAEYNWNPGEWISAPIESGTWYAIAAVIRDGTEGVEDDKFEMWLNGELIEKRPGGQIHNHSDDNGIGATVQNTVFHDEDGSGNGWYFGGMIDEIWVVNEALEQPDIALIQMSVEPANKLSTKWGSVKAQY